MVTLEDILEEIVGEFTTDPGDDPHAIRKDGDAWIVQGTVNVRELNRQLGWELPTDGAKTLNGLVQEQLETIPDAGTEFTLDTYAIEVLAANDNMVLEARLRRAATAAEGTVR